MKLLMLTNEDGEDFTDLVGGDMKQNKNSQKKMEIYIKKIVNC